MHYCATYSGNYRFRWEYRPGSEIFLVYTDERNTLTLIDAKSRAVKVVQIAGIMARRIVCRVRPGDRLEAGERFGIIMFGSRVDIYCPPEAKIMVTEGQRVTSGKTILGQTP